jgi:hypothetical protein
LNIEKNTAFDVGNTGPGRVKPVLYLFVDGLITFVTFYGKW